MKFVGSWLHDKKFEPKSAILLFLPPIVVRAPLHTPSVPPSSDTLFEMRFATFAAALLPAAALGKYIATPESQKGTR